jgi:hypothetical protein
MNTSEVRETLPPYPHKGTVAVDFDATLVKWDALDAYHEKPIQGARNAMHLLRALGYKIVVFTSRLDPTWLLQSGNDYETQYRYVTGTLRRLDIPFDYATGEKIPAEGYIDDKAITFSGNWEKALRALVASIPVDELAWFAGVFEGEGYIYKHPTKNTIEVGIEMTDKDTIERLNAIFPGSVTTRHRLPNQRTYRWRRSDRAGVIHVMSAIGPWLGERRRLKMQEVIWGTSTIATSATTGVGTAKPDALSVGA